MVASSRRRHAFSMLELTLVIAIMGILMAVAVVAFGPNILRARRTATLSSMRTIGQSLQTYFGDHASYPATLAGLVPGFATRVPDDGWERAFHYRTPGFSGRGFELVSSGENGQIGDQDDLDYWRDVEQVATTPGQR